ncbi:CapA family protein [Sporosarcina sp. CAU 1771]
MKKNCLLFLVMAFVLSGCTSGKSVEIDIPNDFTSRGTIPVMDIHSTQTTISIGMIGDILLHNPLYTYDNYDFAFASVKEKLTGIDFLLANQESMPGGAELGYSGYPSFNSPKHIVRDLKANGVDMLSIANNHTIDRLEKGTMSAIRNIKEYDMPYVGAYSSFEDQAVDRIVDVDGVRLGILAYTYGTNGIPVPQGKEYLVSLIERERMEKEIKRLKDLVDVMIVSMHWGNEYQLKPSSEQEELAQFVSELGADIIFGHHPHVLQKYDEVNETKVFYSLGNFYSAQQFDSTNIGGIAKISATKESIAGKSSTKIHEPNFFPTAVIKDSAQRFQVIPLKEAGAKAIYGEEWAINHLGVPTW